MKNLRVSGRTLLGIPHFDIKMKLSTLFFLVVMFSLQANSYSQKVKISLNLENTRVERILDEIESSTEFKFLFQTGVVDLNRRLSIKVRNTKVEKVLDYLFDNTGTTYEVENRKILLYKAAEEEKAKAVKTSEAPVQFQVSGVVKDADGNPLPGASIVEKGTSNGTTSDFDGNFTIEVGDGNAILVVSYVGFVTQEISTNGLTDIQVSLDEDSTELDEVVVTALGQEEKKVKLSYSTQRVTSEESNKARGGDLSRQLGGRIAGLNVLANASSGGLVSSSRLIIRGENSLRLGNNQPLIVIDGVPVTNNQDATGGSFRPRFTDGDLPVDFGNGLSDLNPDDIETIDVLKSPNAAALYGSRAANGVIVITTKSGKGSRFSIDVNSGVTFSKIFNLWDIQTTYGGGFDGEYDENSGNNWGPAYDPNLLITQTGSPSFPNPDPFVRRFFFEDFFQTGYTYNNNVSFSRSNETSNYRFSFTDQRRTGTVPNTEFNRQNISFKAGIALTEKLRLDFSSNYSRSFSENVPVIGFNPQSVLYPFFWGHYNFDVDWFREYWEPSAQFVDQNWPFVWQNNPWLIAQENLNPFDRNRIFGNIKATYQFGKKFNLFFRAGTDYYDDRRESQRPSGQGQFPEGMYREQNIRFQETNIDFLANYSERLNDALSVDVSFGGNTLRQTNSRSRVEGRRLAIPGLYTLSNIENQLQPEQFESERVINSLYGRLNLGWKETVYLDITARNDWSSTLPSQNNSYFYPSAGLSVNAANLLNLPKGINQLKIRANLAQVGNDTDPFLVNPTKVLGDVPGSVENDSFITLTDLKPEITTSFEMGTEIGLFDYRLGLEFNYYRNITRNQILQIPVSTSSGFQNQLINAGKIRNNGVEFVLTASPIETKDFRWDVTANWSQNIGVVEELTEGIDTFILDRSNVTIGFTSIQARAGDRVGDMYGAGYLRSPDGSIVHRNGLPVRGNEIIRVGNYNPDWIAGLSSSINYKGISASILFDYRKGGELFSETASVLYRTGLAAETGFRPDGGIVSPGVIENGDGTFSPNTTNISIQDYWRALKGDNNNIEANTYDATFWKIREVSLGIDLGKVMNSDVFKGLEFSAFVTNVFIRTKSDDLRHIDPENFALNSGTSVPGFEYGTLPPTRTYGLNVKFQF